MTNRIHTAVFASAAVALALLAGPALSAIQPAKQQVAETGAVGKSVEIRVVPASYKGGLGTIWFETANGVHEPALSFGGPR